MNRASYTLLLAGALSACTKPNPLFLDTVGGVSEGGSQADTEGTSGGVDTATTTTTGIEPMTSAGVTGMVTSDSVTTAGPTSGSSGAPACTPMEPLVLQNTEMFDVSIDTFLVREPPLGPGCTLSGDPDMPGCALRNWGAADYMPLAYGAGPDEQVRAFLALRFDRAMLPTIEDLPDEDITNIELELVFSYNGAAQGTKTDIVAAPFNLVPPSEMWAEGVGYGDPLAEVGGASFACVRWDGVCIPWTVNPNNVFDGPLLGVQDPIGTFSVVQTGEVHIPVTMTTSLTTAMLIDLFLGDRSQPVAESAGPGVLIAPAGPMLYDFLGVKASEVSDKTLAPKLIISRCVH